MALTKSAKNIGLWNLLSVSTAKQLFSRIALVKKFDFSKNSVLFGSSLNKYRSKRLEIKMFKCRTLELKNSPSESKPKKGTA